ncbi:hypothetical protein SAMN05428948_1123 [Massilia sp. CF038]|nr:hypothetical protein SAMN05428948_1123 [Massilia sp. CF038]
MFLHVAAQAADGESVYVGKVLNVSKSRIELDLASSVMHIGFVSDKDTMRLLERVKRGQEVRAVFNAVAADSGASINRLLAIRACAPVDAECDADRQNNSEEDKEQQKTLAAAKQKRQLCSQAMDATLARDPRYVPKFPAPASAAFQAQYKTLTSDERACAKRFSQAHQGAFIEACEMHRCGDNVGGGCLHMAAYLMYDSVLDKAIQKCRK